jgi:hypothetical protein
MSRPRAVAISLLLCATASSGGACGKTMTSADCERVGGHLRAVWDSEAGLALPADVPKSERAQNAIRSEGEKMQNEWLAQCRRELEGRKVDQKEVDCLMAAKTVAAIQSCASAK